MLQEELVHILGKDGRLDEMTDTSGWKISGVSLYQGISSSPPRISCVKLKIRPRETKSR